MNAIMMTMIRKLSILLIPVIMGFNCFSQDKDFGTWWELGVKYELIKNLDAEISGSIRTFDNNSRIRESFIEGGITYKFSKNISLAGHYRLMNRLENQTDYYFRHRFFLDIKSEIPAGNFSFSARLRFQRTTRTYIEDYEDLNSKYYGRFKLQAEYSLLSSVWRPYVSAETFFPVFDQSGFNLVKYRFSGGVKVKITPRTRLDLEYIFQIDRRPHESDNSIISVSGYFSF